MWCDIEANPFELFKKMLFSFLSNLSSGFLKRSDFCHIKYFEFREQYIKPEKLPCYNCYLIFAKILFFSSTLSLFWHELF